MKEYIQKLRTLADHLEGLGESKLDLSNICHYFHDKAALAEAIRSLGGKWNKKVIGEDREYSSIQFWSEKYPLVFSIMRDRVCTKKVTYDCEPIFAPDEDEALIAEVNA